MSVEIRHLRQFIVVADELHFTRAAARLHLAQPALSAQIKKLETELNLALFSRNTRAVELTPEGAVFLERARTAVSAYDDALLAARSLTTGGAGRIGLGINPRMRPPVRMSILNQLAASSSTVLVDFVAESSVRLVAAVAAGQVDAALCVAPANIGDLRAILVKNDPLVVALPDGHPLADRDTLQLSELRDEKWILPSNLVYASNSILQAKCARAGFTMQVSETCSDYDDDFTGVANGGGIEVVPSGFVRARQVEGVTFADLPDESIPIHVLHRPDDASPALRSVITAVIDSARAEAVPA